jgi:hypothetical protein
MRGVLVVAGLLAALFAAPAQAQVSRQFGEWMVVCDNLKTCSAFGFSEAVGEGWLKVSRDAGPGTPARVSLGLRFFDDAPEGGTWSLHADGRQILVIDPDEDEGGWTETLDAEASASLVKVIGDARTLSIHGPNGIQVDLSLSGSSASLRFIDAEQGRAGLVDALEARGSGNASAAPKAPTEPVFDVPRLADSGGQGKLPAFIRDLAKHEDCDSLGDPADFPTIWARLGPNLQLWGGICSSGAYNFSYKFFTADNAGRKVAELAFPYAPGSGEETTYVTNPDFDPSTLTLSAFEKGRGLGDCGAMVRWAWNGQAFVLVEQTVMGDCRGVSSDDWPTLYRATIRQTP